MNYWDYSTIFTKPEENNNKLFYSMSNNFIAQVIIRETAFSFILLVSSLKTSRNRLAAILKLVLQYYNLLARGD